MCSEILCKSLFIWTQGGIDRVSERTALENLYGDGEMNTVLSHFSGGHTSAERSEGLRRMSRNHEKRKSKKIYWQYRKMKLINGATMIQ